VAVYRFPPVVNGSVLLAFPFSKALSVNEISRLTIVPAHAPASRFFQDRTFELFEPFLSGRSDWPDPSVLNGREPKQPAQSPLSPQI